MRRAHEGSEKINSTTTFNLHTRVCVSLQRLHDAYVHAAHLARATVCAVCLGDDRMHNVNNNWLQCMLYAQSIDRFIVRPACNRYIVLVHGVHGRTRYIALDAGACVRIARAKHRLRVSQMPLRLWTWYWINSLIKPFPLTNTYIVYMQNEKT